VKPGQKVFRGGYRADPEGFLWEIESNPHFTVT
jgi:hypothetical protein